ncbi:MAG TPA: PHP domain-containing protein, partial [Acidimicrobiales bacterium]|nr:PHP domain-containing protein [Acidimicrobiales bacterium]
MGFTNASVPWAELEARLSGRAPVAPHREGVPDGPPAHSERDRARVGSPIVPYAELHCHSHFSFLDGASAPSELAAEADRLGLEALALTDHDGFYGVVRFAEAAREIGLPTVFGAEVTLDLPTRPDPNAPDPAGGHLVLLATGPDGYHSLCRALSLAQLAGSKGAPRQSLSDLADLGGDVIALTGCRKGTVPAALEAHGPAVAARELARLVELFGRDRLAVELWDHGHPLDGHRNDALAELAVRAGVEVVATNNVHYATPRQQPLATALAAVRARRSLDDLDGWLPAAAGAHLRSGAEQQRRFARYPGAVEATVGIARRCAFDLALVAPALPPFPCPDGMDEMIHLRHLVTEGAIRRYGPRPEPTLTPTSTGARAWGQIDHELAVIEQLGFPGYFLVVWDIVRFCAEMNIFCQGRGSAANSAVCFSLGITRADAVRL